MDKFNSRAGINPKNTSDNLFSTSELELYDDEYDAVDDAVTANVEQASTTAPQKTPKSSTRKSKKSKTNHHQTDSLDYLLTSIARGELEKQVTVYCNIYNSQYLLSYHPRKIMVVDIYFIYLLVRSVWKITWIKNDNW